MNDQSGTITLADIRKNIDQALGAKDTPLARALMAELWAAYPGPASAPLILSGFQALEDLGDDVAVSSLNVCVLRSFAVEPCVPILKAAALLGHIKLNVTLGEFNTYAQDILSPASPAYAPHMDCVILGVQTRDIAPDLWLGQGTPASERVADVIGRFASLIDTFRSHSDAYLLVHNLQQPAWAGAGILDVAAAQSQRNDICQINAGLVAAAAKHKGVHVLDYDALVARHGRANWSDESRWLIMRLPVAMENLHHLSDEWLKYLVPMSGRIAKALVVDLDNTLWGGVLGEDGSDGIQLDGEYPGAAYQAVQQVLLDLSRRGVILAVCSKNDEADALKVIESHPGMLLGPDSFSVLKINWQDKATNIQAIADELNIGTDAIAFLDDNPAERLWVRQSLPEVCVIELSDDALSFADALRWTPVFERLGLSSEDKQRSQQYAEQRQRKDLQGSMASLEDFYRSLDMKLDVFSVTPADVARVAQLTQKTNQFNLTTRRYSEADISRFLDDPSFDVFAARVTDRFGDSGIIAVAIVETKDTKARLDTFLMSCRVIGKTIETGILSTIADKLEAKGEITLVGHFIASAKNSPASSFLADHGFKEDKDLGWQIKLPAASLQVPDWFKA
jgi:FkbH-like protein